MSAFSKTKSLVLQVVLLMLYVLPALSMDADDAPASVTIDYLQNLYVAVVFDHQMHSDMCDCSACHHHTTGTGTQSENCKRCHASSAATADVSCSGCHQYTKTVPVTAANQTTGDFMYHIDKPGLKGAFHLQCLRCHQSENGPTGCEDCHDFTPAGRKRFALKN